MNSSLRGNRRGIILLSLGVIFMIIGAFRGEVAVVLMKAVNICLECIGIG